MGERLVEQIKYVSFTSKITSVAEDSTKVKVGFATKYTLGFSNKEAEIVDVGI